MSTVDNKSEYERLAIRLRDAEKALRRLREQNERMSTALKVGQVGVFEYDPRNGSLSWDDTIHDYWGIPKGEKVTFESFIKGVHPSDREYVEKAVQNALDPDIRQPYGVEFRIINRRKGTERWLRSDARVKFRNETAVRMIGTAIEITGRVQAEQASRAREVRLQAVVGAARLGSWQWNLRTNSVEMDRFYAEMLGYGLGELKQNFKTFEWLLHPDDMEVINAALKPVYRGETDTVGVEIRLRHKEGYWVWVLSTGRVIEHDSNGRPLIMTGTHQDISGRVKERQALEESEARFRETFENAAVGMAHVGLDGSWLRVNGRLCAITGYDRDELLTMNFRDITHPDYLNPELENIAAMLRGEISGYRVQKRYLTKSGNSVWINLTASLQRDAEGTPLYRIAVIEDISEQKRAEEALQRSEERLAAALKGGKLGVYDYDPRTGELNWDRTTRRIWGIPDGEPVDYATFAAGVHPDDLPIVEEILDAVFDPVRRENYTAEYRVINRQNGEIRWLRAEGDTTFEDGVAARLVGTVYDISEQKKVQEALRESELRFRNMADHAPVIIWVTEPDGTCSYLSQKWSELTGQTNEESFGLGFLNAMHPDDREHTRQTLMEANARREPFRVEYRLRDQNRKNSWRWCLATAQPRMSADGQYKGFIGSTIDLTERKEIELALRESELRFRNMADHAPVIVWVTEPDGTCSYLSQKWSELTGQTNEESFGLGFLNAMHPDDREHTRQVLMEANARREPFRVEYRLRDQNRKNSWRWCIAAAQPRISADGQFMGFIGSTLDITDHKEIEMALRESEAEFRLLADNMSQFAWMTDPSGWIYWYNKRWFDYTGTTLEEMQGWGWRKVHHPDHVDRVVELITESFNTGKPWEDTFPLRGKDGNYRWFLSRALPHRDEDGRIVRWIGTNTDITERLKADEHRELLVNELNHRVKNTLAIVQGMAHQTFKKSGGFANETRKAFQQRLIALARAHDLLTQANWKATTLGKIVREAMLATCNPDAMVHIEGPPVELKPKQAITFAIALHELCTNAIKYGALSVETGRVDLRWKLRDVEGQRRLHLCWEESGGPRIGPPPRQRGFGFRMIESALAKELDGEVDMDFRTEGFVCTIDGTLDDIGDKL